MPVRLAVTKLSDRSINMLEADAVFSFLLKTLGNKPGYLCTAMQIAVEHDLGSEKKGLSRQYADVNAGDDVLSREKRRRTSSLRTPTRSRTP